MKHFGQDEFNFALGNFIKHGRTLQGILQEDLCKKLNISQGYYSQIENGKRNADMLLVIKIFNFLNLDFYEFFDQHKTLIKEISAQKDG